MTNKWKVFFKGVAYFLVVILSVNQVSESVKFFLIVEPSYESVIQLIVGFFWIWVLIISIKNFFFLFKKNEKK